MRICDYSSLIFTGNTTVLLILALTTDYWEYRTFDKNKILSRVVESKWTQIYLPFDTDSYFQIKIKTINESFISSSGQDILKYDSFYHAPLFVVRRYKQNVVTDVSGIGNQTEFTVEELELNLFEEYGNLFRDCDSLEVAARLRIGLSHKRPSKCVYFHDSSKISDIHSDAPELNYLEVMASVCAIMCIISISITFVAGAHGLFSRYSSFVAFHIASCSSLIAGFFLTIGIALFHGKCHILRKMEFFPGHDVPYKNILQRHKVYTYGWSFVLAWICVFFSYTAAYVWLYKAQSCQKRVKAAGTRLYTFRNTADLHSSVFINFLKFRNSKYDRHDVATF